MGWQGHEGATVVSLVGSVGQWTLGSFWLPLLAWTVVCGVVLLGLRQRRTLHPLIRYRLGQALLFALPAILLTASVAPIGRIPAGPQAAVSGPSAATSGPQAATSGPMVVSRSVQAADAMAAGAVSDFQGAAPGATGSPAGLYVAVGLGTFGALALAMWQVGLIVLRLLALRRLAGTAARVTDQPALSQLERLSALLGVRRPVALLEGPRDSVPMTFGFRQPFVVVPSGMLSRPDDLRMTLVHELIHVARADFAWGAAERFVCAAFAFHPLVRVLGRTIDRAREASCDLEVIETHEAEPHDYAQLLFSLGDRARPRLGVAAGLAPTTSHLKERIETMTDLLKTPASPRLRARSTFAAVALLGATTVLGACFSMERSEVRHQDDDAVVAAVYEAVELAAARDDLELRDAGMEAQLAYLAAEIVKQEVELTAYMQAFEDGEPGARAGYQRLTTRHRVLTEMYEEHVRAAELLKLEKVAAAATR